MRDLVLLVDDSEELRDFLSTVLRQAGYTVATAANGQEALAQMRAEPPELVLLDVVMPVMDGMETLTRMRTDLVPPVPPVILCSGLDITEEEALRRGAAGFLPKPVESRDLIALVGVVLTRLRTDIALARESSWTCAPAQNAGLAHSGRDFRIKRNMPTG
jgi:CheY-like chemotaxis protein